MHVTDAVPRWIALTVQFKKVPGSERRAGKGRDGIIMASHSLAPPIMLVFQEEFYENL